MSDAVTIITQHVVSVDPPPSVSCGMECILETPEIADAAAECEADVDVPPPSSPSPRGRRAVQEFNDEDNLLISFIQSRARNDEAPVDFGESASVSVEHVKRM